MMRSTERQVGAGFLWLILVSAPKPAIGRRGRPGAGEAANSPHGQEGHRARRPGASRWYRRSRHAGGRWYVDARRALAAALAKSDEAPTIGPICAYVRAVAEGDFAGDRDSGPRALLQGLEDARRAGEPMGGQDPV